jgi:hypothetical protein
MSLPAFFAASHKLPEVLCLHVQTRLSAPVASAWVAWRADRHLFHDAQVGRLAGCVARLGGFWLTGKAPLLSSWTAAQ